MDQAVTLRKMYRRAEGAAAPRAAQNSRTTLRGLAVASGKGGVGKTNTVANMAFALTRMGKRTLVFDADMGLGNIHILLGLAPGRNLQHVIAGECSMEEILVKGPGGIDVLPAGSGNRKYNDLTGEEMLTLKTELEAIEKNYDFILFDIGAGISTNVMYFCSAANDIAILTSTEPTAFADAYAIMKVLSREYDKRDFKLIVNSVKSRSEGLSVFNRLSQVSDRFGLNIRIEFLGHIFLDPSVQAAVREQRLFAERYPNSPASKCIVDLASTLVDSMEPAEIRWGRIFA
jgi:flagellar biosynthesis protein FlhG